MKNLDYNIEGADCGSRIPGIKQKSSLSRKKHTENHRCRRVAELDRQLKLGVRCFYLIWLMSSIIC